MIAMIALCAIAMSGSGQQAKSSPSPDPQADAQEVLAKLGAKGRFAIVADIDPQAQLPVDLLQLPPADAFGIASASLRRTWTERVGVQLIYRRPPSPDGLPEGSLSKLIKWVSGLDDAQLSLLARNSLPFTAMSDESRSDLESFAPITPALRQKLRDDAPSVSVGLSYVICYEYNDPGNGKTRRQMVDRSASQTRKAPYDEVRAAAQNAAGGKARKGLTVATEGTLAFPGSTLPLQEALGQAEAAFGVRYVVDPRLNDKVFFFCGKFTLKQFDEALRVVTPIPAPTSGSPLPKAYSSAIRKLLNGKLSSLEKYAPGDMSIAELLGTNRMTAGEFSTFVPYLDQVFSQQHVPSGTVLGISPGLFLTIDGGPGATAHEILRAPPGG